MPKILIEISEDDYKWIKMHETGITSYPITERLYTQIKNGTLLYDCKIKDCVSRSEAKRFFKNWENVDGYYHSKSKHDKIPITEALAYIEDLQPAYPISEKTIFSREYLECWLYEIAFENSENKFGDFIEDLISRLDGFELFVKEREIGKK